MSPPPQTTKLALYGKGPNKHITRSVVLQRRPQTLLECPWAAKGQWKVLPEGKLAPTDPPPTAETCLQTIRLLDGQLTVYTDGSASGGTKE